MHLSKLTIFIALASVLLTLGAFHYILLRVRRRATQEHVTLVKVLERNLRAANYKGGDLPQAVKKLTEGKGKWVDNKLKTKKGIYEDFKCNGNICHFKVKPRFLSSYTLYVSMDRDTLLQECFTNNNPAGSKLCRELEASGWKFIDGSKE